MGVSSVGGEDSARVAVTTGGGSYGGAGPPTTTTPGGWFEWLKSLYRAILKFIRAVLAAARQLLSDLWVSLQRPSSVTASGLHRFTFHSADITYDSPLARALRDLQERVASVDDETAARQYLALILVRSPLDQLTGLRSMPPGSERLVEELRSLGTIQLSQTGSRLVRFEQAPASGSVFGSLAVCEFDERGALVSAKGSLAKIDRSSKVRVKRDQARRKLERLMKTRLEGTIGEPELTYIKAPRATNWRLTYHFRKVPPIVRSLDPREGRRSAPPRLPPRGDYFLDARNGSVAYSFPCDPLVDAPAKLRLDIRTELTGLDDGGMPRDFYGRYHDGAYELLDPLFNISTRDLGFGDVVACARGRASLPGPLHSPTAQLDQAQAAAVTAHVNASKIFTFFTFVFNRKGVDDKGTELVNVVNCTYGQRGSVPTWPNAAWYYDRMWYGQALGPDGKLHSFARFLDVMAHELMHGITSYTASLVPDAESGALNESFSDIFAIIIKNWDSSSQDGGDVSAWNWEIGPGLSSTGGPLRDISDPARTGAPAHLGEGTLIDQSSIHENSCIHSKAAYNVLTALSNGRKPLFSPRDVALHYYYCLLALGPQADFSEALETLLLVTQSIKRGDPQKAATAASAIRRAYAEVGINERTAPGGDIVRRETVPQLDETPEQRLGAVRGALHELADLINAVIVYLNQVPDWLAQQNYAAAEACLSTARESLTQTEAPMKQLRMRQSDLAYITVYNLAAENREIQVKAIDNASTCIERVRAGDSDAFEAFRTRHNELMDAYNQNINLITSMVESAVYTRL